MGLFQVERLVAERVVNGHVQFKVQWLGYPGEDTWESEANLMATCAELIAQLRSGDLASSAAPAASASEIVESDHWVCCDVCGKWRRLYRGQLPPSSSEVWTCEMNRCLPRSASYLIPSGPALAVPCGRHAHC